jgi:hypothetical protein
LTTENRARSVPPASDQVDNRPVAQAARFEILSRWWLADKILACLTTTGGSPATSINESGSGAKASPAC